MHRRVLFSSIQHNAVSFHSLWKQTADSGCWLYALHDFNGYSAVDRGKRSIIVECGVSRENEMKYFAHGFQHCSQVPHAMQACSRYGGEKSARKTRLHVKRICFSNFRQIVCLQAKCLLVILYQPFDAHVVACQSLYQIPWPDFWVVERRLWKCQFSVENDTQKCDVLVFVPIFSDL